MRRFLLVCLAMSGLIGAAAPADAQWVLLARRALGRVEQVTQPPHEQQPGYSVATVLLDARATKVFQTVQDHLRANPAVKEMQANPADKRVVFTDGTRTATITVTALDAKLTQLMIASAVAPGQEPATPMLLDGVLRVCAELHRHCTVAGG
jgi:hypothetical protein